MTMSAQGFGLQGFGLFDPAQEKDSCGVGFIADIKGRQSHKIVDDALTILLNLEHRGAVGADPRAGDGAGILVQIPHKFFSKKARELGFSLPAPGHYAVGALFLRSNAATWFLVIGPRPRYSCHGEFGSATSSCTTCSDVISVRFLVNIARRAASNCTPTLGSYGARER